jgi:outer membrane protein assembly factor BamA
VIRKFFFGKRWAYMFVMLPTLLMAQKAIVSKVDTTKQDIVEIVAKALHVGTKPMKAAPRDRKRKHDMYFSIIPVSTEQRGGGKVFVSSISSAFYLGNSDSTYLSRTNIEPSTNFSDQFGIGYGFNLWTANNNWNIPGDFKITTLNQYTYGLGTNSDEDDRYRLSLNYIRCYINANQRLANNVFYGFGLNYDRYYKLRQQTPPSSPSSFEKYGIGTEETSHSLGLIGNLLLDTRKNSINPAEGLYTTLSLRVNPDFIGNLNSWTSVYADARRYISISTHRRSILAFWSFYWGAYGKVPYLNLPSTSNEPTTRSGRGYIVSRFRGNQMLYAEAEYRFDLIYNGLLGGVVFCNVQSLTQPDTQQFAYARPAAGFGTRIKFNKSSNTNLTIDFGFGRNSFDFYIGLGEFF